MRINPMDWRKAAAAQQPAPLDLRARDPRFCRNDVTLDLDAIDEVPEDRFFRSESLHGFDIGEIVDWVVRQHAWHNPYTNEALTGADVRRLRQFPHTAATPLRGLADGALPGLVAAPCPAPPAPASRAGALPAHVRRLPVPQATWDQLADLARALVTDVTDDLSGSMEALIAWRRYAQTLTAAAQAAVDGHVRIFGAAFSEQFRSATEANYRVNNRRCGVTDLGMQLRAALQKLGLKLSF